MSNNVDTRLQRNNAVVGFSGKSVKESSDQDSAKASLQVSRTATTRYLNNLSRQQDDVGDSLSRSMNKLNQSLSHTATSSEEVVVDEQAEKMAVYSKLAGKIISRDANLQDKVAHNLSTGSHTVRSRDAVDTLQKAMSNLPSALKEGTQTGKDLAKFMVENLVSLTDTKHMGAGLERDLAVRQITVPKHAPNSRIQAASDKVLQASIDYVKSNQPEALAKEAAAAKASAANSNAANSNASNQAATNASNDGRSLTASGSATASNAKNTSVASDPNVKISSQGQHANATNGASVAADKAAQASESDEANSTYTQSIKQHRRDAHHPNKDNAQQDRVSSEMSKRIHNLISQAAASAKHGNLIQSGSDETKSYDKAASSSSSTIDRFFSKPNATQEAPVAEAKPRAAADSSNIRQMSLSELSARASQLQQEFRSERHRIAQEGKLPDPAQMPKIDIKVDVRPSLAQGSNVASTSISSPPGSYSARNASLAGDSSTKTLFTSDRSAPSLSDTAAKARDLMARAQARIAEQQAAAAKAPIDQTKDLSKSVPAALAPKTTTAQADAKPATSADPKATAAPADAKAPTASADAKTAATSAPADPKGTIASAPADAKNAAASADPKGTSAQADNKQGASQAENKANVTANDKAATSAQDNKAGDKAAASATTTTQDKQASSSNRIPDSLKNISYSSIAQDTKAINQLKAQAQALEELQAKVQLQQQNDIAKAAKEALNKTTPEEFKAQLSTQKTQSTDAKAPISSNDKPAQPASSEAKGSLQSSDSKVQSPASDPKTQAQGSASDAKTLAANAETKANASHASDKHALVDNKAPASKDIKPNVIAQDSKGTADSTKSPPSADKAPVADAKGTASNAKVPVTDAKGTIADGKAPVADAKGTIADGKAPVADVKGSVADGKAPVADAKGTIADGKAPVADAKGSVADGKTPVGNADKQGALGVAQEANKGAPTKDIKAEAANAHKSPINADKQASISSESKRPVMSSKDVAAEHKTAYTAAAKDLEARKEELVQDQKTRDRIANEQAQKQHEFDIAKQRGPNADVPQYIKAKETLAQNLEEQQRQQDQAVKQKQEKKEQQEEKIKEKGQEFEDLKKQQNENLIASMQEKLDKAAQIAAGPNAPVNATAAQAQQAAAANAAHGSSSSPAGLGTSQDDFANLYKHITTPISKDDVEHANALRSEIKAAIEGKGNVAAQQSAEAAKAFGTDRVNAVGNTEVKATGNTIASQATNTDQSAANQTLQGNDHGALKSTNAAIADHQSRTQQQQAAQQQTPAQQQQPVATPPSDDAPISSKDAKAPAANANQQHAAQQAAQQQQVTQQQSAQVAQQQAAQQAQNKQTVTQQAIDKAAAQQQAAQQAAQQSAQLQQQATQAAQQQQAAQAAQQQAAQQNAAAQESAAASSKAPPVTSQPNATAQAQQAAQSAAAQQAALLAAQAAAQAAAQQSSQAQQAAHAAQQAVVSQQQAALQAQQAQAQAQQNTQAANQAILNHQANILQNAQSLQGGGHGVTPQAAQQAAANIVQQLGGQASNILQASQAMTGMLSNNGTVVMPGSAGQAHMTQLDEDTLQDEIIKNVMQTVPSDELDEFSLKNPVLGEQALSGVVADTDLTGLNDQGLNQILGSGTRDGANKNDPLSPYGAAQITTGQNAPIPAESVVTSSTAKESGLLRRLASFFSRKEDGTDVAASDAASKTIDPSKAALGELNTAQSADAKQAQTAIQNNLRLNSLDTLINRLQTAASDQALPPKIQEQAQSLMKALNNPVADLSSVSSWLNFVTGPMSPSSSQAIAMHQWAFMLLCIRFEQIGKNIDKFLKKHGGSEKLAALEPKIKEHKALAMDMDDVAVSKSNELLKDTFSQVERMQQTQNFSQEQAIPRYIPLPPNYEGGKEGSMSARKEQDKDGGTSWHLNFNFDLENMGALQIKVKLRFPEIQMSFVAERFETLQKVQSLMPDLNARLKEIGLNSTGSSARLGSVSFDDVMPSDTSAPSAPSFRYEGNAFNANA